ncbi:lipase family protein [Streptomyces sp. DSM 44917]|uniref:Lipase family protein n=1 Tax=Streptomyces boetiae TaxID=3075541 RepID=A0ABU2L8R8_9ACTN|nr:lipase family protein [Streptomyces sp. DSM 44917]MDT0307969.1 lipase family protein [Streptomyces sp. DSM 44917]
MLDTLFRRRRRGIRLLAPLSVVTLLFAAAGPVAASGPAAAPAVDQDGNASEEDIAFYTPPSPLPAGEPGDIIRARESSAGPAFTRNLGTAWQVMYLSTDAVGEPVAVTGTVIIPNDAEDPASLPIVGMGPGTHGPAFWCAPSNHIANEWFYEQNAVNDMLQAGYAVAITDYEGYHPDPDSTYMVGRSMGPALINAVRAAQRLPEAGLNPEAQVAFRGYSQGGAAAMWAGQLAPEYAPELNVAGVVGGGVPADLVQVALPLEGQRGMGVLLYALLGLDNAYPELDLDSFLTDQGRTAFAEMNESSCVADLLTDYVGTSVSDFTTSPPFLDATWQERLAENRLGGEAISVPVLQYHIVNDNLVGYRQAQTLRTNLCSAGTELTWEPIEARGEHIDGVLYGNDEAIDFLNARFAGEAASSNC